MFFASSHFSLCCYLSSADVSRMVLVFVFFFRLQLVFRDEQEFKCGSQLQKEAIGL